MFYTWNLSTFAGYTTPVGTDTVTGVNLGPNATGTFNFTAFSAIAIRTFPPQTAGLSSLIGNGTFQVGSILVTTSVDPSTVGTVLSLHREWPGGRHENCI